MNLSPLEIIEDDCGSVEGFEILIKDEKHCKVLKNRYVWINDNWKLSSDSLLLNNIGKSLIFRSTITCQTEGFKLCKKCFGEYDVTDKKYVGVIAGQVVAERLTQLSLRS